MPVQPFWWASPAVILLSAMIAVVAIVMNKRIARFKATLDLIERTESSDYYLKIRRSFKILKDDPSEEMRRRALSPRNDGDKDISREIYAYLNHYELVAIGCNHGILDEGFYANWMRNQCVRDWHAARAFIDESRRLPGSSAELFVEYERMARRFETHTERGDPLRRLRVRLGKGGD